MCPSAEAAREGDVVHWTIGRILLFCQVNLERSLLFTLASWSKREASSKPERLGGNPLVVMSRKKENASL